MFEHVVTNSAQSPKQYADEKPERRFYKTGGGGGVLVCASGSRGEHALGLAGRRDEFTSKSTHTSKLPRAQIAGTEPRMDQAQTPLSLCGANAPEKRNRKRGREVVTRRREGNRLCLDKTSSNRIGTDKFGKVSAWNPKSVCVCVCGSDHGCAFLSRSHSIS